VHGWQGDERVMGIFERTVPSGVAIVSPRAPLEVEAGSYGWFRVEGGEPFFWDALAALETFVRGLPLAYPIDPRRVLLMGFSQGAGMSFGLLCQAPDLIMGVAGLAGFLPEPAARQLSPGRLAGKPVFLAHGTLDEKVPVALARSARQALAGAGAVVQYHEYLDVAHKMNAQGVRDLTRWMAAQFGGVSQPDGRASV
jgi:phospholipase/carboxylesterase